LARGPARREAPGGGISRCRLEMQEPESWAAEAAAPMPSCTPPSRPPLRASRLWARQVLRTDQLASRRSSRAALRGRCGRWWRPRERPSMATRPRLGRRGDGARSVYDGALSSARRALVPGRAEKGLPDVQPPARIGLQRRRPLRPHLPRPALKGSAFCHGDGGERRLPRPHRRRSPGLRPRRGAAAGRPGAHIVDDEPVNGPSVCRTRAAGAGEARAAPFPSGWPPSGRPRRRRDGGLVGAVPQPARQGRARLGAGVSVVRRRACRRHRAFRGGGEGP